MDSTKTSTRMKPRHSSNQSENQDSEEIMANIAETRAQMDNTLDELSERLQPRHILDDVIDWFRSHRSSSGGGSGEKLQKIKRVAGKAAGQVKEKASTAGHAAYSGVRQHPIPALLIGAGISMLWNGGVRMITNRNTTAKANTIRAENKARRWSIRWATPILPERKVLKRARRKVTPCRTII